MLPSRSVRLSGPAPSPALPQMPPLEARFGLTYEEGDWSAGGLWRVVARQGRIAENQGNVVGYDFDESAGFAVFSLNGAYKLSQHFKVSAGVDNLFDKRYWRDVGEYFGDGYLFQGAPRTARLTANVNF